MVKQCLHGPAHEKPFPDTPKDKELKYSEYEEHKFTAIALPNRTDRIAYFPHDAFHVAETGKNIAAKLGNAKFNL